MGRSRMSIVKRQRELKKAEKAAGKRAKRHGITEVAFAEPQPTVRIGELGIEPDPSEETDTEEETSETETDG